MVLLDLQELGVNSVEVSCILRTFNILTKPVFVPGGPKNGKLCSGILLNCLALAARGAAMSQQPMIIFGVLDRAIQIAVKICNKITPWTITTEQLEEILRSGDHEFVEVVELLEEVVQIAGHL